MGSIAKKIKKAVALWGEFGLLYSLASGFCRSSGHYDRYIDLACKELYRENKERIFGIKRAENPVFIEKPIVWSFWWQGKDSLPDILQTCLASHEKHIASCGYEYIFLDRDNIQDYLDIPDAVKRKLEQGIISFTHFSDYLRVALIEQYGGIWIDITLLMTSDLDSSMFDFDFYSFKTDVEPRDLKVIGQMVTGCRWAGFMLGANQEHSPLFVYLKCALEAYWSTHDRAIDYFLLNMLVRCAYDHNDYVKKIIDDIPFNNPHLYELAPVINEPWNQKNWNQISKDEIFFKVTQKKPVSEQTGTADTFYGHIKKMYR